MRSIPCEEYLRKVPRSIPARRSWRKHICRYAFEIRRRASKDIFDHFQVVPKQRSRVRHCEAKKATQKSVRRTCEASASLEVSATEREIVNPHFCRTRSEAALCFAP